MEEHLKISDIAAFREGILSQTDHTAAARHLLRCPECRGLLPLPTKEAFLGALFGGHPQESESGERSSIKNLFAGAFFSKPATRNAVFASLLLIAIIGSTFLIWNRPGFFLDANLVAAIPDSRDSGNVIDLTGRTIPNGLLNSGDTIDSRGGVPEKNADVTRSPLRPPKSDRNENRRWSGKPRSTQRSDTRGYSRPCGARSMIDLEVRNSRDGLRLIWNKVPNAVSYAVYLSDLDERLVDHHETSDETSYLVTAPLDKETVYRWKLISTLKNGERVVSESQNFRGGEPGPIPVKKRIAASVRCVEGKQ